MPSDTSRDILARTYAALGSSGLTRGTAGNVSLRDGSTVWITPTGARPGKVGGSDMIALGMVGEVRGTGLPSSEWRFHVAAYRARPEARAVVHCHADAATALSCLGRALPAFHYMVVGFGGKDVPCAPYAPFGSAALAEAVGAALRDRTACLMAHHGMVATGPNPDAALAAADRLETLCRQYLLACQAGTPGVLDDAQIAEAASRYRSYGTKALPA